MSHKPGLKPHLEEIIKKMVKWLEKETKNLRLHVNILNAFSIYFIKAKQSLLILFPFLKLNPRFLSRRKTPPPSSPPSIKIKDISFFFFN